jgi:hypothetical protein
MLCAFFLSIGALAPSAGAAVVGLDGFKYVTKSFELPPGKTKTYKAPCPKGTHVLGGGHYNNGGYGDVTGAHSYPYDSGDRGRKTDDGWAARLRGFTESHNVDVHAICAKVLPEYDDLTRSAEPGLVSSEYGVVCDDGLDPISGGTRGPVSLREISSYPGGFPGGFAWFAAVANHGAQAKEFTALNVCAGLDTTEVIESGTGSPQTQQRVAALCPKAAPRVIGGGTRLLGDRYQKAIAASRPTSDKSGWEVWIDNYDQLNSVTIQTFAVCVAPL